MHFFIMTYILSSRAVDRKIFLSNSDAIRIGNNDTPCEIIPRIHIAEERYKSWRVVYNEFRLGSHSFNMPTVKKNGYAFGYEPATGSFPGQDKITGFQGKRFINTKRRNLGTFVGELQSDIFTIQGEKIDFLIGGGDFTDQTCINLFVCGNDGKFEKQRSAAGEQNLALIRKGWDVTELVGSEAYFQLLDYAPVEPWGFNAAPRYPEDDFGFLLLDDIRQTDSNGNRICEEYDREHNFDFETVAEAKLPADVWCGTEGSSYEFVIGNIGTISCKIAAEADGESVTRITQSWSYNGKPISGVKLELDVRVPITLDTCQYYVVPGLLYNDNPTAEACHYLGEDFPEDAATIPSGFSIEDEILVFGGWAHPQQDRFDPITSIRLEKRYAENSYAAVFSIPQSAQFGRRMALDLDQRLTVTDGWELAKTFYIYHDKKAAAKHMSNSNQGYGQVIDACWKRLYPISATNPPHTLGSDFDIKMAALLDPYGLIQEVERGGRTYRLFYVGRWILGNDFDFSKEEFVPKKFFHAYAGFSWSGMAGLVSYWAIQEYLKDRNPDTLRVAEDTMDFFVDHGMAPSGMLYPVYHEDWAGIKDEFGTYFDAGNIDMGPLGEGLYWYVRCFQLFREGGIADKKSWINAVGTSLDSVMRLFPDGDVPGRIHGTTGEEGIRKSHILYWTNSPYTESQARPADIRFVKPSEHGATNFVYLIWAFVAYYQETKAPRYLKYAELLANQAVELMESFNVFAGSEMDFYNIDKRQGHALMDGFIMLYEATDDARWIEAARYAGNWFATWQHAFNVSFDGLEHLPLGHYDYKTIGGTPVDIKYSTNNLVYEQGATAFLKLWEYTGDEIWFQRARALLHQGVQSTLTEEKRLWLNENYQGPAKLRSVTRFNPNAGFDLHCLGGGTEDVLPGWPLKGNWTSQRTGILSMYMLAEGLDAGALLKRYGSIILDVEKNWADAIDSLDSVKLEVRGRKLILAARNMVTSQETYMLKLCNLTADAVRIDDTTYHGNEIAEGIPITFGPRKSRTITIELL